MSVELNAAGPVSARGEGAAFPILQEGTTESVSWALGIHPELEKQLIPSIKGRFLDKRLNEWVRGSAEEAPSVAP